VKSDCVIIFPNNFRRDLSRDDFFKNSHEILGPQAAGSDKSAQSGGNSNVKLQACEVRASRRVQERSEAISQRQIWRL
jgi:hypothetical protein